MCVGGGCEANRLCECFCGGFVCLRMGRQQQGAQSCKDWPGLGGALDALKEGIAERAENNAHLEAQVSSNM